MGRRPGTHAAAGNHCGDRLGAYHHRNRAVHGGALIPGPLRPTQPNHGATRIDYRRGVARACGTAAMMARVNAIKRLRELPARYRSWNQFVYLSPVEHRLNRSLWWLLAVALVYAVLHHAWLVNLRAVVSWGPGFGVVCYDIAIAYAGAFVFYLLVVRAPLRRDRRNIYRNVGPLLGFVVMHGDELITTVNKAAGIEPVDRESTWENIQELCGKINPNTPAEGLFIGTGGLGSHTVFTVMVDRMNRTRTGIEQILRFSSFLATDLIDLLLAIETYSHFRSTSERVAIVQNTGIGFGDKDLSLSAHDISNYTVLIRELETYGENYLPMKYEDRPNLRAAE
jgi:hypothetical protein